MNGSTGNRVSDIHWQQYTGVFLLSLALTRILSVANWCHFVFVVVSRALLGFGFLGVTLDELQAYVGKEHPKVLIIGSGLGKEVLEALYFGASSITAVEINPIITDIVTKRMREHWGGLFEQPEVRLVTEEGRSFVRRSKEKYDA